MSKHFKTQHFLGSYLTSVETIIEVRFVIVHSLNTYYIFCVVSSKPSSLTGKLRKRLYRSAATGRACVSASERGLKVSSVIETEDFWSARFQVPTTRPSRTMIGPRIPKPSC